MIEDRVINEYFDWLVDSVCGKRFAKEISYRKLLSLLHSMEFTYLLNGDKSRAIDGVCLRRRFSMSVGFDDDYLDGYLKGPCSVLEMMVALSIRCEETIMDDPIIGDRTGQWFWGMITNLGLGGMTDYQFDRRDAENIIYIFLNREYEPNGKGGLFTINHCECDLRDVEIWSQLCWYLDSLG